MGGKNQKSKSTPSKSYSCEYCNRSFAKETTLISHLCEKKRRYKQKDETAVRIAFNLFVIFYNKIQSGKNTQQDKTYDDFVDSPYYLAFVKFGRHAVDINVFDVEGFYKWLLANDIKIDHWCKDSYYQEFLKVKLLTENVADAVTRSISTMDDWAKGAGSKMQDYFKYASSGRICRDISMGLVSPWVIYCSKTGNKFLETLDEENLKYIWDWIDSSRWERKFNRHEQDVDWIKEIMRSSGF